jgi:hypothetical protein
MRLIIIPFDDKMNAIDSETLELANCTKKEIKEQLKAVMKGKLYQIEIYKSLNDSLFIQLDSDSISSTIIFLNYNKKEYTEEVKEHGYENAMTTINEYLEEDGGERVSRYFTEKEEERKRLEKEKFEKWKKTYDPNVDRRDKIPYKWLVLVIIAISLFSYTVYLMWSGEIRFIGKSTQETKAVVTQVKLVPVKGGYYQRVTYEFIIDNKTYKNYYTADKFIGIQHKGDSILVKFDLKNPSISKYISNKNH